jgi:dTDP-3-amino-3,4,6-trideoxy-alpha-D-glucose transaminase
MNPNRSPSVEDRGQRFVVPRARLPLAHERLRDQLLEAIEPILFGDIGAASDAVAEFETAFARWAGRAYVYGVQSGTAGLVLALRACGIGTGDEVVTVANTDISTVAAISHCGATPVLCDVRADDYTMDAERAADLIGPRTRAILPVDLYGHPADAKTLREIADRHGILVVEDAALAVGARDRDRPVGAFADVAVYSFAPYKPIGTAGNAGAVATDDPGIARRLRILRGYGQSSDVAPVEPGHQAHVAEGYHLSIDALQAAVLTVKLPHLEDWTRRRREVAQAYAAGILSPAVSHPVFRRDAAPTFRQYTVCVPNRDAIYRRLRNLGVEVVLHYVPPLHRQPVYAGRGLPGSDRLPITERLGETLVCLPVFPEATDAEIAHVIGSMHDALNARH